MKTKNEKALVSNKIVEAEKAAKVRGFLTTTNIEKGRSVFRVFNKGIQVLLTEMDSAGNAFSRFYNAKGVCIRTLTASPTGAVALIGKVY
jgi:hypothetical protein